MSHNKDKIILKGLKENNLKNINLTLPKGKIIVFTGLSGSGKSSVVFDTLAKESNRQMTFNYPLYVRNQMPKYERPKADIMENLSPAIVIDQKQIRGNIRSTVGTFIDINPLIRLLFSRIGSPRISSATNFLNDSAFGKCPECNGFGKVIKPDINKLIDFNQSLIDHAIKFKPLSPSGWQGRWMITGGLFDPHLPIKDYSDEKKHLLIYGPKDGEKVFAPFHTKNGPQDHEWDGLLPRFSRLYINRDISKLKQVSEDDVFAVSTKTSCTSCHGSGLNPEVLQCKINHLNIAQYYELELPQLLNELTNIENPLGQSIAQQIIPHIKRLIQLGLGYISLSRHINTLSGGEAQRIKIARHLGSSLNNMTYIFDEPSAGLHREEIDMLINMLKKIKDNHNTVIVIEHDMSIIKIADEIVEMGPGAGEHGGKVMFQGKLTNLKNTHIMTNMDDKLKINKHPRKITNYFDIRHANNNNLKNININIPKHVLVSICGVSGSGKSSLLQSLKEKYPEAITVSQQSISISSRSTLATYMGIMDNIRSLLAKQTGQPPGLFSFNSTGACDTCHGKGMTKPDVAFADPVTITCESCHGTRYSNKALSYTYKGKNIVDILSLTVNEAITYFNTSAIINKLTTLKDVGLHYLTLGQTTSSLSGGENQRLKLASHLQKEGQIYILDEPSLGLHKKDNEKLLALFQTLVNKGNSVLVIEHHFDFIASSDWVIELGPGGGKNGGYIMFEGTPHEMLKANTVTAKWLQAEVNNHIS